ncbi:MAG: hypothetical protein HQL06_07535 [Nitrospirae bacterium]|nr:hypothetical protein [Nitrospirota bacterium]
MVVKLYLNEPPGKRCNNITLVVTELRTKYGFNVEVVKKADLNQGVCDVSCSTILSLPAVEINGEMIFEGRDISLDELESEVIRRL